MSNEYALTKPCSNCPFRSDKPFRGLRVGRPIDFIEAPSFPCHKTTKETGKNKHGEKQCAGRMILLEKIGRPDQMMRISERLKLYDRHKLDMDSPVYDTIEELIEAIGE